MQKALYGCNVQLAHGDMQENYNYLTKDGMFFTNIEAGETGLPKSRWQLEFDEITAYFRECKLKKWQQEVFDLVSVRAKPFDRTVHWYWEGVGDAGKSWFAKYLKHLVPGTLVCQGKGHDIFNMVTNWKEEYDVIPRCIVVDQPRSIDSKYISIGALEQLKNGLIFSGKYKGGEHSFWAPHVVVFSNVPPSEEQRLRLSPDRWHVVEIPTDGEAVPVGIVAPEMNDSNYCYGCAAPYDKCPCKDCQDCMDRRLASAIDLTADD